MKKIRNWIAALLFVATAGGATMTLATAPTVNAACNDTLLTFPAWFKGLTDGSCNIKSPTEVGGLPKFIWHIALNIVETMLQLVGYVAVIFIIIGGFKYMTATGQPAEMAKARSTILNAVIGLIISIFSVAIVTLVSGSLK